MANKINFITGETYTLSELFSGDRRIIIPDLQRDYCWGDENNTKGSGEKGELVTGFVNNLLGQFEEYKTKHDKGCLNLGLFYGYEVPADHIQLCDGQQRLTTLYLLLGMINKKKGKFRQHLISDFEYNHDDKEPYLNYAIRESSLYFMSDLVCKFFIDNNYKVQSINSADWYFDYYNLDPSIQSMLKALAKIEKILDDKKPDLLEFGDWLLNKVTFLYFDMENRKNGEETFVVINTTGESLSSTQNLKPLVIQEKNDQFDNTSFVSAENKNIGQCWEEIETWFWQKRQGDNDTAEAGFAEFLRWVSMIEQVNKDVPEEEKTDSIKKLIQIILQGKKCEFPYKTISFKKIYDYWKALKWIGFSDVKFCDDFLSPSYKEIFNPRNEGEGEGKEPISRNAIGQKDCFVLLPVLRYVYKNISTIESNVDQQRNTKRIYEFFKNLIRIKNVSKAVNTLVGDTLKIVDLISGLKGDLVDLINPSIDVSGISTQILSTEEKRKLEILKNSSTIRNDVEEAFWEAQEHKIWSGEILPMIEWSTDENGFNPNKFNNYKAKFAEVFVGECDAKIDVTRRALLTRDLNSYPRIFKGGTNYSFGWEWSDWKVLINDNKDKFKLFFDDLLEGKTFQQMIDDYANVSDKFYRFVKYPELLSYCEQKKIQKKDSSYILLNSGTKKGRFLDLETFCLYLELKNEPSDTTIALNKDNGIDYNTWKMWLLENNPSALVFEKNCNSLSVAIDVHYNRTKDDDWDVQLFSRSGNGNTETDLIGVASLYGLDWDTTINLYVKKDLSRTGVIDMINNLFLVHDKF